MNDRETLVFQAILAEQAERYDEMRGCMKRVVLEYHAKGSELQQDERKLLASAYKNLVGSQFLALSAVASIRPSRRSSLRRDVLQQYKQRIETELSSTCDEILRLLVETLLPNSTSKEAKVFFCTMMGDFYRFLLECRTGAARKETAQSAQQAYEAAMKVASTYLHPTHPIRLGLAESFSACYEEGELVVPAERKIVSRRRKQHESHASPTHVARRTVKPGGVAQSDTGILTGRTIQQLVLEAQQQSKNSDEDLLFDSQKTQYAGNVAGAGTNLFVSDATNTPPIPQVVETFQHLKLTSTSPSTTAVQCTNTAVSTDSGGPSKVSVTSSSNGASPSSSKQDCCHVRSSSQPPSNIMKRTELNGSRVLGRSSKRLVTESRYEI